MIPENPDELHALAGEYVLGVLDPGDVSEIETATVTNAALREAVAFLGGDAPPAIGACTPNRAAARAVGSDRDTA
jgi:hypothetical protein